MARVGLEHTPAVPASLVSGRQAGAATLKCVTRLGPERCSAFLKVFTIGSCAKCPLFFLQFQPKAF